MPRPHLLMGLLLPLFTGVLAGAGSIPPGSSPQATWVSVQPGGFLMGSPDDEPCREPYGIAETLHPVTLTHGFEISSTEVTQGDYAARMGANPASNSACGPDCPVERVSWYDAAAYCNALSQGAGLEACYSCAGTGSSRVCRPAPQWEGAAIYDCPGYRLPTEAEWELAYRAGTTTAYYNGDSHPETCDGADPTADQIGWYDAHGGETTHPVGQLEPNALGLFDMAGNVNEWVHDHYADDLGEAPAVDPVMDSRAGRQRVVRGGSINGAATYLRGAFRHLGHAPSLHSDVVGFRCARTISWPVADKR